MAPGVAVAATTLAVVAIVLFLVAAYFTTLTLGVAPGLSARLGTWLRACGADAATCSAVARTPYARLFGGVPNAVFGMAWAMALLGLAVAWIANGRLFVPLPYLYVAAASVATGAVLIHALVRVLRQRCPLCMTAHVLHFLVAAFLLWLR